MAVPSSNVYTGFWTNWSKGKVDGATITVTSHIGAFLLAFIAMFIQVTGRHLWHIVCYLIHHLCATEKDSPPIIRQQQVILRNTSSPIGTAIRLFELLLAYGARTWTVNGALYVCALALVISVGFGAAGITSAYVVITTNVEVLLKSPHCGFWTAGT
jgi:hypothetical protein